MKSSENFDVKEFLEMPLRSQIRVQDNHSALRDCYEITCRFGFSFVPFSSLKF